MIFVKRAAAELREDFADFLCHAIEKADDVLRFASVFFPQFFVLGRHADGQRLV